MSDANKAMVRRLFEEVWNNGNMAVVDEICSDRYVAHSNQGDMGRAEMKTWAAGLRTAFPDMRVVIHALVAERDDGWRATRSPARTKGRWARCRRRAERCALRASASSCSRIVRSSATGRSWTRWG